MKMTTENSFRLSARTTGNSGAIPERSRRCKWEGSFRYTTRPNRSGKVEEADVRKKTGNRSEELKFKTPQALCPLISSY
jgi:hypothetical protein